jgi:hypothetical protein
MSSLGEAALAYARKGVAIFPCNPRGKKPLTDYGFKDATTDDLQIREWWTKWPLANIGISTGVVNGIVALDIDPGGDDSLAELTRQYGPLPQTCAVKTGRGRQLWFMHPGVPVRCTAGKLGQGLDVRGDGGYVVAPPSIHPNGQQYAFLTNCDHAEMPEWLIRLTVQIKAEVIPNHEADSKIPEGNGNAMLTSIAGSLRRQGLEGAEFFETLRGINSRPCNPPLAETGVSRIAASIARWSPSVASRPLSGDPWSGVESMDSFLNQSELGCEFLDSERRLVARASITQLFSPRGLGKSLYTLWLALGCARRGLRVLLLDRDNPRNVVRSRLRSFGAESETTNLKVLTREKCSPLTNAQAWANFPYAAYDLVILDSLDSATEGVGEQDSAKPSKAIAPLLDIARREKGPAVIVLGNTVMTGRHSRSCGVVEDRADIIYEVRDATDFHPSGAKPWVEELPPADAGSWAGRSSRRKRKEKYRLAFVASKFRIAEEPEPFILEIDTSIEPWTVGDVIDLVDLEGAAAREQRASEKQALITKAASALVAEIERRNQAGESPMAKRRDAEGFLVKQGLKRAAARECLEDRDGSD